MFREEVLGAIVAVAPDLLLEVYLKLRLDVFAETLTNLPVEIIQGLEAGKVSPHIMSQFCTQGFIFSGSHLE